MWCSAAQKLKKINCIICCILISSGKTIIIVDFVSSLAFTHAFTLIHLKQVLNYEVKICFTLPDNTLNELFYDMNTVTYYPLCSVV